MDPTKRPAWIAGAAVTPNADLAVTDKATGRVAFLVPSCGRADIGAALAAGAAAEPMMRRMPAYARRAVLEHCVRRFRERAEELAQLLCVEAGKPIRDARGEVTRLVDTFQVAADESTRLGGEVMDMEISPRARGYRGMYKRVPVGLCSFLTPFNFPLNLVAHKVAPAIAAGCPFVLKPSPRTPVGALVIGEILAETDLPPGAFSVVPCDNALAPLLVSDARVKLVSFTGSRAVGHALPALAGPKRLVLELGGNAACIVDADADLDDVVRRLVVGAFYQSGQSCISVQRILAHEAVYDDLRSRLVTATRSLVVGPPGDEATFVGPLIDAREADRVMEWIAAARADGARVLCGAHREGATVWPTLLEGVPRTCAAWREEVFAPVACLAPFSSFDDALREVNDSAYGLQAGVFTRDLYKALRAWDELDVGGVIVGDVPSWRVDHMPYGGVKASGLGREGVKWAMMDMTEVRLLVVREP